MQILEKIFSRVFGIASQYQEQGQEPRLIHVSRAVFNKVGVDIPTQSDVELNRIVEQDTDIGDVESTSVKRILWGNS